MARDRGFQLDLMRRTAGGRLAQVWGRTAPPSDLRYRPLDLAPTAARAAEQLQAPERELLDAFTSGVNGAWARHGPPFECRFLGLPAGAVGSRGQPADRAAAVPLALLERAGRNGPRRSTGGSCHRPSPTSSCPAPRIRRCRRGLADLRAAEVEAGTAEGLVLVDRGTAGSNCWVRGNGPGGPVLAGDLHLPLAMPNLLYEVDLRWSDGQVRGLAAAGLPVVLVGTNGRLAWGVTNLGADVLDLVPVTGEAQVRTERIHVRGRPDVALDAARVGSLPVSARPPSGQRVALRWAGYDPRSLDLRLQRLAGARSVEEGVAVLDDAYGIALNVLLTDASGRMAHLATGVLGAPVRLVSVGPPRLSQRCAAPAAARPGRRVPGLRQLRRVAGERVRILDDPDPGHRARRLRRLMADAPGTGPAMRELQHDLAADLYRDYRDLAVSALRGRQRATGRTPGRLGRHRGHRLARPRRPGRAAAVPGPADPDDLSGGLPRSRPGLPVPVPAGGPAAPGHPAPARPRAAAPDSRARRLGRVRSRLCRAGGRAGDRGGPALAAGSGWRWGPAPAAVGTVNAVGHGIPWEALAPWSAGLIGRLPGRSRARCTLRTCVPGFGSAGRPARPQPRMAL